MKNNQDKIDFICFSHLRWDFVYQRPQHLLSRCSEENRVFFIEEPIFDSEDNYTEVNQRKNVIVIVPHIKHNLSGQEINDILEQTINQTIKDFNIKKYLFWYYTPMALNFSRNFKPISIIFDCMDELSAFKFAPQELLDNEAELINKADLVFTGGESLYQAKKDRHPKVYKFPSSIDFNHFSKARENIEEPDDQKNIAHPKLGFFGVVDERMDLNLLNDIALAHPEWNLVIIGPVVKINPEDLPKLPNIHYLGSKNYQELPAYLSAWDVALLPFAINESTKFISPTKTPEYLAGGKPAVSTAIEDVIHPYGDKGFVYIANDSNSFIKGCESYLDNNSQFNSHEIDVFLSENSWNSTWERMSQLIESVINDKNDVNEIQHYIKEQNEKEGVEICSTI